MNSIVLLCSGALGAAALRQIHQTGRLHFVFTDKGSAAVQDYCQQHGIAFFSGNPRNGSAKKVIAELKCSILLSVNYLFIVEADLLSIACDHAINLHGSLLPKYRGRTPHVWAIINGEKETGITAHKMAGEVDSGQIVHQVRVPIGATETGFDILKKFEDLYPQILTKILDDAADGKLDAVDQDHTKATYFGRRTPEDGRINWDWQKERIHNWVRAQAAPYPGAFTFYEGQKVIINKIGFSEMGYTYDLPNGCILQSDPEVVIKTPNGAVTLEDIIPPDFRNFKKGTILG